MKEPIFVKYDQDDILEILLEYLGKHFKFNTWNASGSIFGTPDENLRFVAAIGELEDESIDHIDLEEIDQKMDFNGSHSQAIYLDIEAIRNRLNNQDNNE